jgi:NADH-quinone oxidoreductase subunit D
MINDNNGQTVDMMLNMGPQHPSTHGVFRMELRIDGEKIIDVTPHIGYLHRGSEKLSEGEQYHQVVTLFDRLDYLANFNNEFIYCRAVEKLLDIEVSERTEYVRVILSELNRIASHLLYVGTIGLDAGAMTPALYSFIGRDRIQTLFESISGARMMHNYFKIGGLREDVPADFVSSVNKIIPLIKRDIDETEKLLTFNEIFLSRTKGIGVINKEAAIDFGLTGPCLRGSGVSYDVRKTEPYSIYNQFEFDIPIGLDGDCWDRHWVRVQEMHESLRIVEQAINKLPQGSVESPLGRRLIRPPKGEVYVKAENPRGEIGIYLISDGTDKPYRLKVRPPSFCNLSALQVMLKDAWIADSVVILGSLDIVLGEVDR